MHFSLKYACRSKLCEGCSRPDKIERPPLELRRLITPEIFCNASRSPEEKGRRGLRARMESMPIDCRCAAGDP